ncbi:MAG: UbiD family decarboxylase [Acidobacteria bacterium]|nr:UbiD family decarboxylase [Acidobacteriota bacterium]
MPVQNLRQFLQILRYERDLRAIDVEVDPCLEVAEIHRRVIELGGPALLFNRVKGSSFSVVTNLFGTPKRIELAFGTKPLQLVKQVVHFAETLLPPRLSKLWENRNLALEALKLGTKTAKHGPVLEVVEQPADLQRLPILTTWRQDGGPFITLPLVYTEHPKDKRHNLGMYRLQRHDASTTGMHWQIGKGGGFHYSIAEQLDEALPVTVSLGGPPALILAAIAPLPENVGELMAGSLLAGERIPMVRYPFAPHPMPAEAEFVLQGRVPPRERRPEGPFGDHYGYYSLQHDYPVFHVEKMFRRRDAIYPATVVGKPRQEDFFIGDYLQELLSPLFPLVMPGVRDLWSYGETGFHSLAAAVVRERYGREAMASAFRILGEGQLSLTKFLIATDSAVDLRNFPKLLAHVLERVRWETDLFIFANLSMDTLDYCGPEVNKGSKAVLLGLGQAVRSLPRAFIGAIPSHVREARAFCPGCLVVSGRSYTEDSKQAERVAQWKDFGDWQLIILTDDASIAGRSPDFLWSVFTRFEPAADIYAAQTDVRRHHLCYSGPIVIDARMKPSYPEELVCDLETARKVDARWGEYFPGGTGA